MSFIKQYLALLLTAAVLTGCGKPATFARPLTLTQAQEQFLKICREELKYDVKVIPVGKTMWVYVPLTDGIFEFRAASKDQSPPAPTNKSWSITFLESTFSDKTFTVRYDIAMTKKYDKKQSYQNKYSDEYSKKQREVLTALTRAYFDVGQTTITVPVTVGNDQKVNPTVEVMKSNPLALTKEEPPDFFVMVFADTKHGVGIQAINNFEDMRMALSNPPGISNDEYVKRYVYELFGDEDLIGDTTGEHLKTQDITMGYFLAKQIENRINTQFVRSAFPPTGQVQDEIWHIISETCRLYQFKDFEKIKLIDLQTEKESTYDKSQL
ncbi:MAG: hypothetical protein H6754_06930 [Candidatus Omnitrophica bacterium]|nr:hypothetical protein [Candidatus Omnitrophota bacterium]